MKLVVTNKAQNATKFFVTFAVTNEKDEKLTSPFFYNPKDKKEWDGYNVGQEFPIDGIPG